jgi:hypothetical protein
MGHAQTASVSAYVHDVQREVHQFFAIVSPLPRVVYNLRRELAQYASHVEGVTGDNGLSSSAASVGGAAIDVSVAPHTPHLHPKQAPTSKQASIPKQAGAWDVDRGQPEVRWSSEAQGMPAPGDGLEIGRARFREEEIGRARSWEEEIGRVRSREEEKADRDDPRVQAVVGALPPYVESRYKPAGLKRLQVVKLALGAQFIAASSLRRIASADLALQMETDEWPGPRQPFLI